MRAQTFTAPITYYISPSTQGSNEAPWSHARHFFSTELAPADQDRFVFVVVLRNPASCFVSAYMHFCIRSYQKNSWRPECNGTLIEAARKSTADLECNSPRDQGRGCSWEFLQKGQYDRPLEGWVSQFPNSTFIIATMSHHVSLPGTLIGAIGVAGGGSEVGPADKGCACERVTAHHPRQRQERTKPIVQPR